MAARKYTIGILCPLQVELSAVIATFDEKFEDDLDEEHNIYYYPGRLGNRYVVAVCLPDGSMGLEDAVFYAGKLKERYESLGSKSSLRFLVGIAGGNPDRRHDIRLGDVVIGKKVVNYEKGKKEGRGILKPTDSPYDAPGVLLNGLNKFMLNNIDHGRLLMERRNQMVANFKNMYNGVDMTSQWTYPGKARDLLFDADYNHKEPDVLSCDECDKKNVVPRGEREDDLPVIHTGLIASSNSVLKDGYTRKHLEDHFTEILAVEMEASALKRYEYIVIRGICDYADSHKNKCWQPYAAATAAACCAMLIEALAPNAEARDGQSSETRSPKPVSPQTQDNAPQSANVPDHHHDPAGLKSPKPDSQDEQHRAPPTPKVGFNSLQNHVYITWKEMEKKDTDLHEEWEDATIELLDKDVGRYFETSRSLAISKNNSGNQESIVLWLPPANIKVTLEENIINLRYADCNGIGYKTAYKSSNGIKEYKARYNPSNPNVEIHIDFAKHDAAKMMFNNILYLNRPIPKHVLIEKYTTTQCDELMLFNIETGKTSSDNPLAIMKLNSFEQKECDLSYLDCFFDFTISTQDGHTDVMLDYLKKPLYQPKQQISSSWPPEEVKKNVSGEPDSILEGGMTGNMKFSLEQPVFTAFMEKILAGWRLLTHEFEVDILWPPKSKKGSLMKAQSTIWVDDGSCHILTRIDKTEDTAVKWIVLILKKNAKEDNDDVDLPVAQIANTQLTAIFPEATTHEGNLVCRTTMLSSTEDTGGQQIVGEILSHSFKFQNTEEIDRFVDAIEPYANVVLQEGDSSLLTLTKSLTSDTKKVSGPIRRLSRIFSVSSGSTAT